jgi:Domain of unknown function (DUF5916)
MLLIFSRWRSCVAACLALWLGVAGGAWAQPHAVSLPDHERIKLDGHLDDPVWQTAPVLDRFVQFLPVDRLPPPAGFRTTVQVVMESDALVIGVRAFDPDPSRIRAPLVRRDQVRRDQDFIGIVIDPVGDRRSAQFVRINAIGVLADGRYQAAGDIEDFAPDFGVDGAAQRLADGYSVEVRLPFIALRYPRELNAPWRLMVTRSVPRESSVLLLSAPLTKDGLSFIAELQAIDGLEDLPNRLHGHALLSVTPELTLRRTREQSPGAADASAKASLGVDLKWRPRADWVLDATLNPDFAQVELDLPQLTGNTRFALSVPEKRGFFLESTDVIDLPLAGFYSRSIADPDWGLRATWRGASADATALVLRDDGGGSVLRPSAYATAVYAPEVASTASVWRARQHLGAHTLGALASVRHYAQDAGRNLVIGVDGYSAPTPQDQFRLRALASATTAGFDAQGVLQETGSEQGHWIEARWNRRSQAWILNALVREVSPRFRNDNGFVAQSGIRTVESEINRRWGEVDAVLVTAHEFETFLWMQHTQALADAAQGIGAAHTQSARWHAGIWWAGAKNSDGVFKFHIDRERAQPTSPLRPVHQVVLEYGFNPAPWFTRAYVELQAGDFLDVAADRVGPGRQWTLDTQLRWQVGRFGLESQQRLAQLELRHAGQTALRDVTANWIGVLHLSSRDTVRAIWQVSRGHRLADPTVGLTAYTYDERSASIVVQHRVGLGRSASAGVTQLRSEPDAARKTEVFVKLSASW